MGRRCGSVANRVIEKIAGEWLLVTSLIGLGLTSLWRGCFPAYTATDFYVIYILFVFLVIIKGLEESCFLKKIEASVQGGKGLSVKLVLLTAVLSMFVTNDVALLTVVPLTLALEIERKHILIILETLSANAASALTPFGNPQNIFIFYHYHIHPAVFVRTILPFCLVSLSFILFLTWKDRDGMDIGRQTPRIAVERKGYAYVIFFFVFIVAVLKFAPLWLGGAVLIYAVLVDRRSLRIDWLLLLTFLAFFGFTDNLVHLLRFKLSTPTRTFFYAALGSQVISNVPGVLLFADFTHHWRALLWGVSVGGFGNLIGSLASLITYRLYKAKAHNTKSFLMTFHVYGYAAFLLGILTFLALG